MVRSAALTATADPWRFLSETAKQLWAGLMQTATSGLAARSGVAKPSRNTNAIAERVLSFMVCVYWGCLEVGRLPGPLSAGHRFYPFATAKTRTMRGPWLPRAKGREFLDNLRVFFIGQDRLEVRCHRACRQLYPRPTTTV